jgi:lipoprotein-anchoring transpeptidase ErfK/SrfK
VKSRSVTGLIVTVVVLLVLAFGGYAIVSARAGGSGTSQPLPTVAATQTAEPSPLSSPSPRPERWLVAKVVRPVDVRTQPASDAPVKVRLEHKNINGYPNVMLVKDVRQVGDRTWYHVYLAMRPNGSTGWVPEGDLAIYTTSAKIVIDLSQRQLTVTRRGQVMGTFPVAVGAPGLETPTGYFYVNQKLKPPAPGGPFGVLAIGISAFQMKLPASAWAQGGPVAIHGTNQPELIGQAVSHGCVRMKNADVLKVDGWVPTGSPVLIQK